jgi:hypothetical protein
MISWHGAALLVVSAVLLWAFAVLLPDLLKERMRGWLRVMLVVVLAPACALATLVVSVAAGIALTMAFEPYEAPASLSEPPERTEPAKLETTSEETILRETTTEHTASPSAMPSPSASSSVTPYPSVSPSASPSP